MAEMKICINGENRANCENRADFGEINCENRADFDEINCENRADLTHISFYFLYGVGSQE